MRREKSLRIGVHRADAVVRGPVYRTHLQICEPLRHQEHRDVRARGGIRSLPEPRDVDDVPRLLLHFDRSIHVEIQRVIRAEFDVRTLRRVAPLDADRLAVAVVLHELDEDAELDAHALGLRGSEPAAGLARHLAERGRGDVIARADEVEDLPDVLARLRDDAEMPGAALRREALLQELHRALPLFARRRGRKVRERAACAAPADGTLTRRPGDEWAPTRNCSQFLEGDDKKLI
eukprot:31547-Pelagococcus_subviridis.AAC.16